MVEAAKHGVSSKSILSGLCSVEIVGLSDTFIDLIAIDNLQARYRTILILQAGEEITCTNLLTNTSRALGAEL